MDDLLQSHLDHLVGLVASIFEVPIAVLSCGEEDLRQISSCVGLERGEAEGVVLLCGEAAGSQELPVAPDTLEDPRVAGRPIAVGGRAVRFCAAAPIRSSDGVAVGALCVLDTVPRPRLSPERLRTLADLAMLAQDHIELRRQVRDDTAADELRFELAAIVDSSDDAILSKTLNGTITSWNKGAEKLYGYQAEEIVGRHISLLVPPDRPEEVSGILTRIRRGEAVDHLESVRLCKDGTPVHVSLTISPVRGADGAIRGASTIARDISDRKALEASLAAARDAQIEANRMKSDFLATMSHEIRTPMNGVIGMTGLLLDTDLDSEQREYAETVRSSAEALLSIINEILDFSKIEAGKMELELMDFDLRILFEDVADLLSERAHAKGLELAVAIEPEVPLRVRGDAGRLRQILMNLLGNAVKFTERGEIVVSIKLAQRTDGEALLRIEVDDTGVGVAPDRAALLFEPFSQGDASTTRTHGGTGLGLAISKRLAELMGGEIGVQTAPGEGSCFWFTTRLAPVHEVAAAAVPREDLRGLRVLVVDDNQTNRRILEQQVDSWGMRAGIAEGGARALELLHAAAAAGEPYDVALLDMEMPGMDGLALARAIRDSRTLPPIPLLLLTSSGIRGSADEARAAGISAFLTKPVRQSRLYDALAIVMGSGTPLPDIVTRHTISEVRSRARPRLLLAEDNTVNQQVALGMLRRIGYRADVVANGAEAVDAVSRIRYGAVLMDCQMPEMDGYQATREIRSREGGERHIPIIAMTAGAMQADREACLAAGMDDYISKPVDMTALAETLKRWVEGEGAEEDATGAGGPSTAATLDPERISLLRSLQQEGQPDVLAELAGAFFDGAPAQLAALSAAVADGDADALKRAGHALKGSAANLGAAQLADLCAELETLGRSDDEKAAAAILSRLEIELARVRTAFERELGTGPGTPSGP